MRQRQLRFASVNRIILLLYVPLSVLLAIYYFFMSDLPRAALALLTIPLLALPQLISILHLRMAQLLLFCYLLLMLFGYSGGLLLQLGHYISIYSIFLSIGGGFIVCLFAAALFCCFTAQRSIGSTLWFCNVFCICVAMATGFVWELIHSAILSSIQQTPLTLSVLLLDCTMIVIGSALFCTLTVLNYRKGIHTYPLYVFEDFAALNIKSSIQILPPE